MKRHLALDSGRLAAFCTRHGVRKLSVFGSFLEGNDRPEGDIDLLVEFQPTAQPTLLDLAAMEEELSGLLGGRRVDLRTPDELSRYFRDDVMRRAEAQYVA